MGIKEEKKQTVEEIAEKINKSKEVIFVDYRGLSVHEMADLRKRLRDNGVDFSVYKNTLSKLAVDKAGYKDLEQFLSGPTAVAFDYDEEVSTPKIFIDFAKEHEDLEVKGGLLEDELLSIDQIKTLARMPSKEELYGQVVGAMAGTIRSMLYVLNGPIESFSRVVKQLAEN